MEIIHCNIKIFGHVQGVAFRHYTKLQADRTDITGWVRNCEDGSVEAVISGTQKQVDDMIAWFYKGSPAATVTSVEISPARSDTPHRFFEIRY